MKLEVGDQKSLIAKGCIRSRISSKIKSSIASVIPPRMSAFASKMFFSARSFSVRHRNSAYAFFLRFEWFFVGFELLSLGLLAAKFYLYGDGLDCIMDGIQNEQQANNETYRRMLRSFCRVYGHIPGRNSISKNETFIQSLDYFIATERGKEDLKLDLVSSVFCGATILFLFLSFAIPLRRWFALPLKYQNIQIMTILLVLLFVMPYTLMPAYFEPIVAENPELFKFSGSDSLLELVLKIYRFSWWLIIGSLYVMAAITIIQMAEVEEDEIDKSKEQQECERWNNIFAKLGKISKAIRPKEEVPPKQVVKKTVSRKPKPGCFYSIGFNMNIFTLIFIASLLEYLLVVLLVYKEGSLGNSVDCILEGIQNEAQTKSEPYRELVRNTCGMIGVPPNYMRLKHGNDSFFMRIPEVHVGKNQENSTNETFRINNKNEFGGRPDHSSIRQEEELHRKSLVLALAFLLLLQLFIAHKFMSSFRHFYGSLKSMATHILYLILTLLILVLCKSLTFGQTHLFSSDRVIFRGEQQVLPISWYNLPKMEPQSQASLLSYLLNSPKLNFEHYSENYPQLNNTKELRLRESIAHQPHSDNKISHGSFIEFYSTYVLPWYTLVFFTVECIFIGCLMAKAIQIVYHLIQGSLFADNPWKHPSFEERCERMVIELDEMCEWAEKKVKFERLQENTIADNEQQETDKLQEVKIDMTEKDEKGSLNSLLVKLDGMCDVVDKKDKESEQKQLS